MLTKVPASRADYPALTALWRRSVDATHHFLAATDRETIQAALPTYFAQVDLQKWLINDQLVGFSGTSSTELVMLFIDPAYFRHGYGHEILTSLIETDQLTTVSVNAQNPGALQFYQHLGFEVTSRTTTDADGRPYPLLNLTRPTTV